MKTTFSVGDRVWFADFPRSWQMDANSDWTLATIIEYDENRDTYRLEYEQESFGSAKLTRLACDMRHAMDDSDIDDMVAL